MSTIEAPPLPKDRSIKVWTSDHVLKQYLTSKRLVSFFVVTSRIATDTDSDLKVAQWIAPRSD